MSQRKLIVSLTIAVLLAITAGVSQASLSRMEGMGLDVPLLSQFTDDYANIYTYPTSVVRQNNLVLAELGTNSFNDGEINEVQTDDQSYTVIRNFPRLGAIAFQMAQSQTDVLDGSGNLNNEQLDIIWGRAFSTIDFAVRLDVTNSSYEYSDNTPATFEARGLDFSFDPFPFGGTAFGPDLITGNPLDVELNTYGITPSVALHFGEDDRLELAGTYRRFTFERTETPVGENWEDAGNASYALFARGILHRGGTHTWYPAAWYVNNDLSWEATGVLAGVTVAADETYKHYGVGISDNMRVNDNNLLLWGVMVSQDKHQYERTDANTGGPTTAVRDAEDKTTMLPLVFAAIETEATSWLKVRIGASRGHVVDRTEVSDFATPAFSFTEKTRSSAFQLGLGAGIRWNNLDIDMTVNEQFPLSGGYILSGNEETPFNRVSATYHF